MDSNVPDLNVLPSQRSARRLGKSDKPPEPTLLSKVKPIRSTPPSIPSSVPSSEHRQPSAGRRAVVNLDNIINPSIDIDQITLMELDFIEEEPLVIPTYLTYDGSYLGRYEWSEAISWIHPCSNRVKGVKPIVLYAHLTISGYTYPVILKRNCSGKRDQIIIDELKPLFGLNKMGTHRIILRGIPRLTEGLSLENGASSLTIEQKWANYYVFRATTCTIENGKTAFVALPSLTEFDWSPPSHRDIQEEHRKFYYEIQKIFIFRELVRVMSSNLDDILVRVDPEVIVYSIDEMTIRFPDESCTPLSVKRGQTNSKIAEFFFPHPNSKIEVILKMLGLTSSNYLDRLEQLSRFIEEIIIRIDPDKIWLVDQIINRLVDDISVHYAVQAEINKTFEPVPYADFNEAMELALSQSIGRSLNYFLNHESD